MAFDADRFQQAKFKPRTASVPVEALAAFFADGDAAEFVVRGLSSNELHRSLEAAKRRGTTEAIVEALAKDGDKVQALRDALGLGKGVPGEIAKRITMLEQGSVSPKLDETIAVKLAETFPIEFMTLTNKITELTGMGFDMGEPAAASPQTPDSSQACESPSSEAATSTSADPT